MQLQRLFFQILLHVFHLFCAFDFGPVDEVFDVVAGQCRDAGPADECEEEPANEGGEGNEEFGELQF